MVGTSMRRRDPFILATMITLPTRGVEKKLDLVCGRVFPSGSTAAMIVPAALKPSIYQLLGNLRGATTDAAILPVYRMGFGP